MSSTASTDFAFSPKVWSDHVMAFFRSKLIYGAFAASVNTLTTAPGLTINFPYYKTIGTAETPGESTGLTVDNLSDDSFSATVQEIGKAVGVKKKLFKSAADTVDNITQEVNRQIGRRIAEKVDSDLLTEFSTNGNFINGYTATLAAHTMNVRTLLQAKIVAFGDRANEAIVCTMHSKQFLDLMNDTTAGFLKADALDPLFMVEGFQGRLLGMAIIMIDSTPATAAQINSTNAYRAFIQKMNPYGFIQKQEVEMEQDYDLLQREYVFTGTQWYAVKSFHGKVASNDYRTAEVITTVST